MKNKEMLRPDRLGRSSCGKMDMDVLRSARVLQNLSDLPTDEVERARSNMEEIGSVLLSIILMGVISTIYALIGYFVARALGVETILGLQIDPWGSIKYCVLIPWGFSFFACAVCKEETVETLSSIVWAMSLVWIIGWIIGLGRHIQYGRRSSK